MLTNKSALFWFFAIIGGYTILHIFLLNHSYMQFHTNENGVINILKLNDSLHVTYWHKIKPFHFDDKIITALYFDFRDDIPRFWVFGFRYCHSNNTFDPIHAKFNENGETKVGKVVSVKLNPVCRDSSWTRCQWNWFIANVTLDQQQWPTSTIRLNSVQISTDASFLDPNKIIEVPVGVAYKPPTKSGGHYQYAFALCIQPVYYYEDLVLLVQFIEIWKLLGVEFFYFYVVSVSNDIHDLLQAYEREGVLQILPWPLLPVDSEHGPNPNGEVYRYGMDLALNDCIFRTSGKVEFLGLFDLDEFLIPYPEEGKQFDRSSLVPIIRKALDGDLAAVLYVERVNVEYDDNIEIPHKFYGYDFDFNHLHNLRITEGSSQNPKLVVKPDKIMYTTSPHYIKKLLKHEYKKIKLNYMRPQNDSNSRLLDKSLRVYHLRKVSRGWGDPNVNKPEKFIKSLVSDVKWNFISFLKSNFRPTREWGTGSDSLQNMSACADTWRGRDHCKTPTTNCQYLQDKKDSFVIYDSENNESTFYVLPL